MRGVDVSHYQTMVQLSEALKTADFAFVKATEGTNYVDPEHAPDIAAIRAAKRIAGHYHFAREVGSAYAEAQWFLDHANPQPGDLVALDLESMNGSWTGRASYAVAWLTFVQKATGAVGFRYMNRYWHDALESAASGVLDRWPLWIATGGLPAGQPGVTGWVIHQWSTAAGIDHDVTSRDLWPYAVPSADPKPPITKPEEDDDMKSAVTTWDAPDLPVPVPNAKYIVDMTRATRTWLQDNDAVLDAVALGAVERPISVKFMAGTTLLGTVPHI